MKPQGKLSLDHESTRCIIPPPPYPISVIVDNIRSAYNVGSIFRTADSAGVRHVYLTGYSPAPTHRKVAKTALGAEDSVPWSRAPDIDELIDDLKTEGTAIVALERAENAVTFDSFTEADFPLALLLGNEVAGVPERLLEKVDAVLSLPQYGVKTSLNVSVAFGVAAYGLVERYLKNETGD